MMVDGMGINAESFGMPDLAPVARPVGAAFDRKSDPAWLGRSARSTCSWSTISMPDTASNQKTYPQPKRQALGVGLARAGALFGAED